MCIDLKHGLSLWDVPEDNLSISASRHHFPQIESILRQNSDAIGVIVQRLEEGLRKHLLKLGCVQSSLVLSGFLEGVHCSV